MFRIVNRLIQWTGKYKRRIYIGFIYAFIHSIFTAIPIMLAAKGLSAVVYMTMHVVFRYIYLRKKCWM